MEAHKKAIAKIAASVRYFFERNEPYRIFHGSTNSTRPYQRNKTVDISALSNVLMVDVKSRTALVEPNVPMDRLVESTLKHNLIPPVVMEFPGITAGGGFAGTSGESSSFKYGFFNRTINSVEMTLANGDIVTASEQENADLFHGASGAVGSLGITTMIELQLVEAKRYVKTTYYPVQSIASAIEKVQKETLNTDLDYVDGIVFSKDHAAIITGELTDDLPENTQVQRFSDAKDPWYYLHVKDRTCSATSPITEYIPIAEYLFRYDRGGFWVGRSAFEYFRFPFNRFTRWWLDDFVHTRMLYKALHASSMSKNYIVQDLALPYATAEQFINYTAESFGIWPLWLCPLRQSPSPTLHPHFLEKEADGSLKPMLNIGLWGWGPSQQDIALMKNRELERKLREFRGMKWLYAHTYYTEKEFWDIYDRTWYDELRKKYHATSLPSVWQKVKVNETVDRSWSAWFLALWPIGGFWGIRKAIQSGQYLIARNSTWKLRDKPVEK